MKHNVRNFESIIYHMMMGVSECADFCMIFFFARLCKKIMSENKKIIELSSIDFLSPFDTIEYHMNFSLQLLQLLLLLLF